MSDSIPFIMDLRRIALMNKKLLNGIVYVLTFFIVYNLLDYLVCFAFLHKPYQFSFTNDLLNPLFLGGVTYYFLFARNR